MSGDPSCSGRLRRAWLRLAAIACLAVAPSVTAVAPAAERGAESRDRVVLVVGDSLSAEYGLRRGSGWVEILAGRASELNPPWRVVNASVSGETTAGGRSRLGALLERHRPSVVVIELGGNDALRGLDLRATEANLQSMTQAAREADARVLLLGMQVPPNYGRTYTEAFAALFGRVAQREGAKLVPFFLEPIASRPDLFQPDRIHPTEAAQPLLFEGVWPTLRPMLAEASSVTH